MWGNQQRSEVVKAAGDILCEDLRRKLTGKRAEGRYYRDVNRLADMILDGGFEELSGVPQQDVLQKYENR